MQHHILFQYGIGYPMKVNQCGMHKGFFSLPFFMEHIREIHKMTEIMNPATGNQVTFFGKVQAFYQVIQQAAVHILIINKPDGFSLATVFNAFFNFLDDGSSYIVVDIDLRIPGNFKDPRFKFIITEIRKNIPQVVPYDIFQ